MIRLREPAYKFVLIDHIVRVIEKIHDTVLVEAVDMAGDTTFVYIGVQDAADFAAAQAAADEAAATDAENLRTELERSPWPPR